MSRYSFLTSPRWIGLIVLMIIASIVCFFLGQWQQDRYEQKVAAAHQIETAWDRETTSLEDLSGADEWRATTITGQFIEDSQVLLRGRSVSGEAAYQVIALMETELDGKPATIIIDRGWIPRIQADGDRGVAGSVPPPPEGTVTVEGRVRPAEEPNSRQPAEGYIYTLNPAQVVAAMPEAVQADLAPVFDGRVELAGGQAGAEASGAPRSYPKPSTSLGSHLAYAWEWRFFAVAALAVVPILARREASENSWIVDGVDLSELDLTEDEMRDLGLTKAPREGKKPKKSTHGPTDEEIEDQILDQASAINSK